MLSSKFSNGMTTYEGIDNWIEDTHKIWKIKFCKQWYNWKRQHLGFGLAMIENPAQIHYPLSSCSQRLMNTEKNTISKDTHITYPHNRMNREVVEKGTSKKGLSHQQLEKDERKKIKLRNCFSLFMRKQNTCSIAFTIYIILVRLTKNDGIDGRPKHAFRYIFPKNWTNHFLIISLPAIP